MAKKGRFYTRPDGLKEAIRTINGKRVAFRGKTDREVEQKMREYKEKEERGKMFAEVADEWEREHEREVGEAARKYYSLCVRRLKEFFDMPIKEIRPLDIKRYMNTLVKAGYAGGTARIRMTTIKQILSFAVIEGYIEVSPAAESKMPKNMPKKERNALTEDQEEIVRRSGIERNATFWLFPYLLLYTGMRRGEAAALTYEDIDRKNGVIHVTKKINYVNGSNPKLENFLKSKNGKRDIPLLPPLADALPKNAIGLIFSGKNGYMTCSEIQKMWRQYCEEVGLVDDSGDKLEYPITPHCLRHSFATICFEAGLDPRSAAQFLGDDVQTLETVYTHLRTKKQESAAEKLVRHFEAM